MTSASAVLLSLAAYLFFCKLWPFVFYPNYLRKAKIETYPELTELAARLKGSDRVETLRSAYAYMQDTYTGYREIWRIKNLRTLIRIGDFSTEKILSRKQFLWCHTQNRLLKSILVHTGDFTEKEIVIKRVFDRSFFIHQWLSVQANKHIYTVDPHCGIFEEHHEAFINA
ncbi:MAG: hypothetical protein JWM46_676 [Candidatus Kaiserbacteria bacterium]|nr:hypothetical protein [Candidatus Kaiserbacteria bacterium]